MSSNRGQQAPAKARPKSPPVAAKPAPAPQDDLFSLDFHSAPTSNSPASGRAPPKDVKNDIMSLFSSAPPAAPSIPNSTASWGGSQAWGAPQQASAVPAGGDPWGSFASAAPATSTTSQSFFGDFGSASAQPQQVRAHGFSQRLSLNHLFSECKYILIRIISECLGFSRGTVSIRRGECLVIRDAGHQPATGEERRRIRRFVEVIIYHTVH